MKLTRMTLVTTASLSLGSYGTFAEPHPSPAVQALRVDTCLGSVGAIRSATLRARFASPMERTTLVGKLDDATAELDQGRVVEAARKLDDYGAGLRVLVAAGRLAPSLDGAVTPQALIDGARAAHASLTDA